MTDTTGDLTWKSKMNNGVMTSTDITFKGLFLSAKGAMMTDTKKTFTWQLKHQHIVISTAIC